VRARGFKLAQLATAGALCGVVGIIIIYAAWRFSYPYAEEMHTRREVAVLARRVNELRAEQRRLQRQTTLLGTPEGMKIEARRLGLLKPGERSLRFMARPEPRAPATLAPAPPAEPKPRGRQTPPGARGTSPAPDD
jgi:cell division protein FtsB